MQVHRFEDLYCWQQARALVRSVYDFVLAGSAKRDFSYRDQICRAALSVMTNIAEGFSRRSRTEFARYLDISRASAREVQSLLYTGRDLHYLDEETFAEIYRSLSDTSATISRLLATLPHTRN
jgi:four helix bundle protein